MSMVWQEGVVGHWQFVRGGTTVCISFPMGETAKLSMPLFLRESQIQPSHSTGDRIREVRQSLQGHTAATQAQAYWPQATTLGDALQAVGVHGHTEQQVGRGAPGASILEVRVEAVAHHVTQSFPWVSWKGTGFSGDPVARGGKQGHDQADLGARALPWPRPPPTHRAAGHCPREALRFPSHPGFVYLGPSRPEPSGKVG